MKEIDVAVAQLAARQRSLVHSDQVLGLGMTVRQLQARVASRLLVRVQPNVFRMAAATATWEQRVLAACMSAGAEAAASHRCAAVLWGLRGSEQAPVEITVPSGRRPSLIDVLVHRTELVGAHVMRRGIPVSTPPETLLALAGVVDAGTLKSAIENAILRTLTTVHRLEELGRSGRNGAGPLRRVLAERGSDAAATESVLEDKMVRLLRRSGLPAPERQYPVGGVRLDFAYPERKLGIEVNGVAYHSAAADVQRNCTKANRLVERGWRVLQFTWADVNYRADQVVRELGRLAA